MFKILLYLSNKFLNTMIMKKLILTILGLFTLIACSDEVYQEIAEQQNSGNVENTPEDPENTVFTDDTLPGQTNYQSPFGNPTCCSIITYIFDNTTTDLVLQFNPLVSLARFDDVYDTTHFGWSVPFNATNYPNLLLLNGSVNEADEDNNTDTENVALKFSPEINQPDDIIICDTDRRG